MPKSPDRSTDALMKDMQSLDKEIDALRQQKRALGQQLDQQLTDERATALLDTLSDGERDAIARISTQVAGAAPQKGEK